MRPGFVPIERDASMNVSSRTARVCARISRANPGIITIEMARIAFWSPAPSMPTTASARTSGGKLARPSMTRIERDVGAAAPEAGEQAERHGERASAMPTIWKPERSDTCAP